MMNQVMSSGAPVPSADLQVALGLADRLFAAGRWSESLDQYRFAGQAFLARDEPHNALAVYILASRMVPNCLSTQGVIAGLLHKLGRSAEALSRLDHLAASEAQHGRPTAARHFYRLALEIDPEASARRVWAAELSLLLGDRDAAVADLVRAGESLRATRRTQELIWVARRIGTIAPKELTIARLLIVSLLDASDLPGAVQWLRYVLATDPADLEGRELLARCYAQHGNLEVASRIYKMLAKETRGRGIGFCDEAKRLLEKAVEVNPADEKARSMLRAITRELVEIARTDFDEEAPTGLILEERPLRAGAGSPRPETVTNVVQFPAPRRGGDNAAADDSGEVIFAAFG